MMLDDEIHAVRTICEKADMGLSCSKPANSGRQNARLKICRWQIIPLDHVRLKQCGVRILTWKKPFIAIGVAAAVG